MNEKDNSIAYSEVLDVLQKSDIDVISRIPLEVIKRLKNRESKEYISKITDINDIAISTKARAILGVIYRDYLCDEEEKEEYNEILKENEQKYQQELRQKYSPDNIFKNETKNNNINNSNQIEKDCALIEYKQSFIKKLIETIKKWIKNK